MLVALESVALRVTGTRATHVAGKPDRVRVRVRVRVKVRVTARDMIAYSSQTQG